MGLGKAVISRAERKKKFYGKEERRDRSRKEERNVNATTKML
jgi:hypothetical protein